MIPGYGQPFVIGQKSVLTPVARSIHIITAYAIPINTLVRFMTEELHNEDPSVTPTST